MKRICLDMDEVLADTYAKFEDLYEERFDRRLKPADYHGMKIYDLPGAADIRNAMHEPGFFRDLPVMDGAREVVEELYEHYEIFVTTAATEFKHSLLDKWEWLHENMPFIHHHRIVLCGDKRIVHGDFMIDDKVRNLSGFNGTGLLFTASHNVHDTGYHRVNNWREVRDYFRNERKDQEPRV